MNGRSAPYFFTNSEELIAWRKNFLGGVVLTNGVFDILHYGHLNYLQKARELGDFLLVLLNSDLSVQSLNKGENRPINNEQIRAYNLTQLRSVDGVIIFKQAPIELMKLVSADIYVKGEDYNLETINQEERTVLESVNTDIRFLEFTKGFSTTSLIESIKGNP